MKMSALISLSFVCTSAFAASPTSTAASNASCVRCGTIERLLGEMKATPANPANKRTEAEQTRLFDRATDIIPSILKKKTLNLATARAVLTLAAKANQYTNDGTLGEDNSQDFIRHWGAQDKTLQTAASQLVAEGKITEQEKTSLLEEMGVLDSPGAPKSHRTPQALPSKSK